MATVVPLLTQQQDSRESVLWPALTIMAMHAGTFLFYYADSISHLLAADSVTRVFVSVETAIGWQWFKHGLCGIVWSNTGPSADYRLWISLINQSARVCLSSSHMEPLQLLLQWDDEVGFISFPPALYDFNLSSLLIT